jgi:hypothetical protein
VADFISFCLHLLKLTLKLIVHTTNLVQLAVLQLVLVNFFEIPKRAHLVLVHLATWNLDRFLLVKKLDVVSMNFRAEKIK